MPFDGRCIVVQVNNTEYCVAVPPVAQPGAYAVVTKPLGQREAFKVCKELNQLDRADYSDLTKEATWKPAHDEVRHI